MIDNIKTRPKRINLSGEKLVLAKIMEPNFRIVVSSELGMLGSMAYRRLIEALNNIINCDSENAVGEITIVLKISNIVPDFVNKNVEQGYKLYVDSTSVRIVGFSDLGLYYGVTTFLQALDVINNRVEIERMMLDDFPDLRTRSLLLEPGSDIALMTLNDYKSVIDDMVEKKLNQLIIPFYYSETTQSNFPVQNTVLIDIPKYPKIKTEVVKKFYSAKKRSWVFEKVEVKIANEDFFDELIKYGKSHGVEVFPLWDSFGHNTLISKEYPEVAPLLSNGERSQNGFCVSSETTYDLIFNIYDYIIDKYLKPNSIESFHIGLDLINSFRPDANEQNSYWCECSNCKKLSREDKLFEHAVNLIRYLKERSIINVYLYSDVLTDEIELAKFKELLERENLTDVAVLNWYSKTPKIETTHPELELRSMLNPQCLKFNYTESVSNLYQTSKVALNNGAEGICVCSSTDQFNDLNHSALASLSWNFKAFESVDSFIKNYTKQEFDTFDKEAKETFEYIDKIKSLLKLENEDLFLNNFLNELFFDNQIRAYVNSSLTVNYPCESIKTILKDRDVYEKILKTVCKIADKGYKTFEKITSDGGTNVPLATEYALELKNMREISSDYLSFIELHDLSRSARITPSVIKKMLNIVAERKQAKINIIRDFECIKEDFLIPNKLRGLSVIMQTFDDIETHLMTVKGRALRIDMTDLSPIFTKLSKHIR